MIIIQSSCETVKDVASTKFDKFIGKMIEHKCYNGRRFYVFTIDIFGKCGNINI